MTIQYFLAIALSFYSCQLDFNKKGSSTKIVEIADNSLSSTNKNEELKIKVNSRELEKVSSASTLKVQSDNVVPPEITENSTSLEPTDPFIEVDKKSQLIEEDLMPRETVEKEKNDTETGIKQTIDHRIWNNLLMKYVSVAGKVNYAGIKENKGELEKYLDLLSNNPPLSSWSDSDQLSYWINAYNAFTIRLIIDNYPLKSITKLHDGKPWDVMWITIGSKTYSLNQIENEIIRPQFKEPRIHFAVNCAAVSCPPLTNKAYTANNLEQILEENTKAFINNPQFNTITGEKVEISKIFDWYKDDFGDLIHFLNMYTKREIKRNVVIKFKEYNWALNNQ